MPREPNLHGEKENFLPLKSRRHWRLLLVVCLATVFLIVILGGLYIQSEMKASRQMVRDDLATIADLKVGQIVNWYRERSEDAEVFANTPVLMDQARQSLSDPPSSRAKQDFQTWMAVVQKQYGYARVVLYNAQGMPVLTAPEQLGVAEMRRDQSFQAALHSKGVMKEDLHRDPRIPEQNIRLGFWIPIGVSPEPGRPAEGALLLEWNPYEFLYPLIQSWPVPNATAETLLVRTEGNDVVYLNELRYRKNTALNFRRPLTPELARYAAQAIQGQKVFIAGEDYRHVPVLAAIRHIPGTPWFILVKVDQKEVFTRLRERALATTMLFGSLGLTIMLGAWILWHRRSFTLLERQLAVEQRFRTLFETANDAILLMERDAFSECNSRTLEMFGCGSKADLLSHTPMDFSPARQPDGRDSREKGWEYINRALGGRPQRFYWQHHRKDGTPFDAEVSLNRLELQGKTCLQAIVRDISERKQAEADLRESEARFRALYEKAPLGISRIDSHTGRFLQVNAKSCEIHGYPCSEMLERNFQSITHPDDLEEDLENLKRLREGRIRFYEMDKRMLRPDGSIIWVNLTVVPEWAAGEPPTCHIAMVADITERKRAEAALLKEKTMSETVINNLPGMFFMFDRHGRLLRWNKEFAVAVGKSEEELARHRLPDNIHPDDMEKVRAETTLAFAGQRVDFETRAETQYGLLYCRFIGQSVSLDGELYLLGTCLDITERKRTEEALLKAKTEAEVANQAKDQFIAVLSHELRTPLTPILLSAAELETERDVPEGIRAALGVIRRNVELEMKLIDDLLDVTRISRGIIHLHQEVVDAHACLHNALEICQSEIATKHLNISLRLEADQPYVWADPARLQQIFWNLLRNAVKFTPEGGEISIRSANNDDRLHMEFSDTGIGIEPSVLSRIFNAFEQAERGKVRRFGGLGLGLSISKALVELHHGTLTAFSEGTDKGATFTLELATAPEAKAPPVATRATPLQRNGSKKILLVEDNADTLRILTRMLQKWGYTVRTADCVRSALEEAAKEPFDLLVSDIGLPDGSGLEIMQQAQKLYGVSGIAISGFGTEDDIRQSYAAGFREHLVKPVNIQDLNAAVQRITSELA